MLIAAAVAICCKLVYIVTVNVNPSASVRFELDAEAPVRLQEGEGIDLAIPSGIALVEQLFLPSIVR